MRLRPVHVIRWGLPVAIFVAGVLVAVLIDDTVGQAVAAAAICVVVANLLFRYGFTDQADRDREEAARVFFDEHGHWPDERPGT